MITMHMHRLPQLFAVVTLALATSSLASCFQDPDIYTAHTEVTAEGRVVKTPRLVSVKQLRREAAAPGPRVHVEGAAHDFGRLDPLTTHQHAFVIRNVGDAVLELSEGPTSCKCTLASLTHHSVAPGEKTTAVVHWNTGRDREYSHSATIYTNDPRNKVIQLKIKGEVQVLLRCEPEELVFSRLDPGETASATTLVYSQVWKQLDVSEITPSRPGVTYTLDEATPEETQTLGATSARRLTVTVPDDLGEGYFTIPVHILARGGNNPDATDADCELTLQGKVLRRLCVYGPDIDVAGTIMMGRIMQGEGASLKLLLKIRDVQKTLPVRKIETVPESLQVRVEPYEQNDQQDAGLYHLYVDLPKDAPTFRLPPDKLGLIRIQFDHPRAASLKLPVDLIVAPREAHGFK